MELFELIQTLSSAHGPSGDEADIRNILSELASPMADEVAWDTMGNLIVHRKGPGSKVMLAAHMDSIGFIVTHIEKEGFLRMGKLGGISPKEAVYTPIRFKNGVRGVVVPEEKADFGKLKLDECYIDIGARDEEQAKKLVQVGDTAVYDSPCFLQGSGVISPYLDNRISCAVLLAVLERIQTSANDLYFVFTSQEEVGLRGAKTAAWAVDPDWAIAVDVTDVDDTPGSERSGTVQLGKGAAVKVMDSSIICHPEVVAKLEGLAQVQGISVQRDIMRGGGTDAGAIHTTRLGVKTGGISVPCRYIHTPVEMADLGDAEACIKLVEAFAQTALNV
ncbi:M42 family metallopeptidase [Lawsonibacter sp. OA9]|jgi:endoglucanase|uniref:M42 family metallopeptidase n=1 Tax=Flintibacter hominis TaxID=2763048 RepID=A0A8J6M6Y7_9FIRM|nr:MULTISPECIES: M42 family metallopeptidase [Eubacteriales]MBC5722453.1 M42 family metallopeptidase [Flintibacter hominis]MBS5589573.1 M42 family metallopeptidase [Clostridiales bacterium]MCH1979709.1 M42 family metallopeptidase [Lawsonibacter sp. OA9]